MWSGSLAQSEATLEGRGWCPNHSVSGEPVLGLCVERLGSLLLPMGLAARTGCPGGETTTSNGDTDLELGVIRLGLCSPIRDALGSECDDHAALEMTIHRVSLKMEALPIDQEVKGQLR